MSVVILYFTVKPSKVSREEYQTIVLPSKTFGYVRVQLAKSSDVVDALQEAKPRVNETVLNTVEVR